MTQRWQRELKKLGGVDAPVSRMRAQIANGPSQDPPPPEPGSTPAQRITAGVVAFAVFAAAGVFAYRALRPGGVTPGVEGPQTVTIDLSRSSDASPTIGDPVGLPILTAQFSATVTAGGSSIQEAPSSVCVSGSQCLSPAPRPLDLTLTSGSPVHLSAYNVQGRVDLSQTNGDSTDTLLLTNDSTLPGPGHYLLQLEASSGGVSAFWNYTVEVVASATVQTPEPTLSPPAGPDTVSLDINTTPGTSDCPGGPEGTIAYGDQSAKAFGMSFTWTCPGSGFAADTTTPSFTNADFIHVPVGTTLLVSGDFTSAEGRLQTYQGDFPWNTVQDFGNLAGGHPLSFDPGRYIGRYIMEVTAHWSNGDRQFYFPIELVPSVPATPSSVPSPPSIPDVLDISCNGGPIAPVDATVAVQIDGLHIRMVGPVASDEQIAFYGRDDYFLATTGMPTFASGTYTGEFTQSAATGIYDVKCFPKGADPATINAATTVRVVDPNHFWVSTELGCPVDDRGALSVIDGPHPTQEAAVRALGGVVPSDTVEPAGYTQDLVDRQRYTDYAAWRVVRNGEVVAWTWVSGSQGSWQAGHGVGCISAGTGHPPTGPSPSPTTFPSP